MLKPLATFAAIVLAACTNDGGNESPQTTSQTQANVALVETRVASNGCLMYDNAEARTEYTMSGKLVANLVWNCAEYDTHKQARHEIFAAFNDASACFEIAATETSDSDKNCRERAAPVAAPQPAAKFGGYFGPVDASQTPYVELPPQINYYGRTQISFNNPPMYRYSYGLLTGPHVENIGNIPLFLLHATITLEGLQMNSDGIGDFRLPNDAGLMRYDPIYFNAWILTNISPLFFSYDAPANSYLQDGAVYTVRYKLYDAFEGTLDEQVREAVVNY